MRLKWNYSHYDHIVKDIAVDSPSVSISSYSPNKQDMTYETMTLFRIGLGAARPYMLVVAGAPATVLSL